MDDRLSRYEICSLANARATYATRRSLARVLASTERYNGKQFIPIHQQFMVSREAMAIRIEELALV